MSACVCGKWKFSWNFSDGSENEGPLKDSGGLSFPCLEKNKNFKGDPCRFCLWFRDYQRDFFREQRKLAKIKKKKYEAQAKKKRRTEVHNMIVEIMEDQLVREDALLSTSLRGESIETCPKNFLCDLGPYDSTCKHCCSLHRDLVNTTREEIKRKRLEEDPSIDENIEAALKEIEEQRQIMTEKRHKVFQDLRTRVFRTESN